MSKKTRGLNIGVSRGMTLSTAGTSMLLKESTLKKLNSKPSSKAATSNSKSTSGVGGLAMGSNIVARKKASAGTLSKVDLISHSQRGT